MTSRQPESRNTDGRFARCHKRSLPEPSGEQPPRTRTPVLPSPVLPSSVLPSRLPPSRWARYHSALHSLLVPSNPRSSLFLHSVRRTFRITRSTDRSVELVIPLRNDHAFGRQVTLRLSYDRNFSRASMPRSRISMLVANDSRT